VRRCRQLASCWASGPGSAETRAPQVEGEMRRRCQLDSSCVTGPGSAECNTMRWRPSVAVPSACKLLGLRTRLCRDKSAARKEPSAAVLSARKSLWIRTRLCRDKSAARWGQSAAALSARSCCCYRYGRTHCSRFEHSYIRLC
jgi:hypothetical protein